MTDTTTTAKALTKQTVGGNSNTWGTIENATWDLVDAALGQTTTKAISVDVTLTSTEAQKIGYKFTGALAANRTVTWPTFYGPALIRNSTTGGFTITVGMASGATVKVGSGSAVMILSDGTDFALVAAPSVPASVKVTPANPTGTTSGTSVMMGLGATALITPRSSGTVIFMVSGDGYNSNVGNFAQPSVRYGTGAAPANGAAATGTAATNPVSIDAALASGAMPFCFSVAISGLTVGTQYWFDLALNQVSGGTATVENLTMSAVEIG